jgi:hypothetical protein
MSMISPVRMLIATQPTATVQPVPYSAIPAGQVDTDPLFFYNPVTQELSVPGIAITTLTVDDLTVSGDITFTREVDHLLGVADSTTAAADGGDLTIFTGDGAIASGAANGGAGGDLISLAGNGGAGLAAQTGGPGGDNSVLAGDGGAGTAGAAAGAGGNATITAGDGGTDNGGGGANGGDVTIDAGAATGAGVNGDVVIGGTAAINVILSRLGGLTAIASQSMTFIDTSANHLLDAAASAATVAGRGIFVRPGQGGAATAGAPGGTGGAGRFEGSIGGAGSAAQAAGAGGTATVIGGNAGADGGAGGANGGSVDIDGGTATGAGTAGAVNVGTTNASAVTIGRSGQPVNILGNTQDVRASRLAVVASPDALLATDYFVEYTGGAGITANLPALATVRGRSFLISILGGSGTSAALTPNGAETISTPLAAAQASFTLDAAGGGTYQSCILYAPLTGTDWKVVSAAFLV